MLITSFYTTTSDIPHVTFCFCIVSNAKLSVSNAKLSAARLTLGLAICNMGLVIAVICRGVVAGLLPNLCDGG